MSFYVKVWNGETKRWDLRETQTPAQVPVDAKEICEICGLPGAAQQPLFESWYDIDGWRLLEIALHKECEILAATGELRFEFISEKKKKQLEVNVV